ncbi:MAG: outer membrane lipoprotein chaperone LolA [candidate division KSB1 bacterium]|nr:outer membrane lipoprotein chaperone LolA [candidate division KSB1 bacterium]MDZ7334442.1 outer membrane lipoprotein chaperone LolA [candidate division KSB1 bacterium]MDZ7355969.1 outer membrane lipoprotein chaperone LolA [candidate division KSB1 bacterium]MDZ7375465.1 outer membrane lipoprotein chaperone LolA [candidate division KSB1 bacterium]MDZ7400697.1 outer membrane lipoprotein chaperone LolA [candidate division KSB1 bacterium]
MKPILILTGMMLVINLFCLQTANTLAQDPRAVEIINKVKAKYDALTSFQADFEQTSYWKLADNVQQQKGRLWLKGKDKFRIETQDQIIVSDGKTVWTHSLYNNQVIIDRIENSSDEIRLPKDLFLKYSENYSPRFVANEIIDQQDCAVVELKAKSDDIFIKTMKIWINTKISVPIKIEQTDINDNLNTYRLLNVDLNKPLLDKLFHYAIPDSVEIIDMR